MNRKIKIDLCPLTKLVVRYEAYCTPLATHGGVASPRNGTTIPRRRALLVTEGNPFRDAAMNAHYTSSNRRF
jgi:hypothetical protein